MENIKFSDLFDQVKLVFKSKSLFILSWAFIFIILLHLLPQDESLFYFYVKDLSGLSNAVYNLITYIVYFVFSFYYTFILMIISKELIEWNELSVKESFDIVNSKIAALFTTSVTTSILLVLLTLLLVIPWLIYGLYWMFAIYAVLFNNLSNWEARAYSKKLTQWRWWGIFFLLLHFSLYIFLIVFLISFVSTIFLNFIFAENLVDMYLTLFMWFISIVLSFLWIVFNVSMYLKLEENTN